MRNVVIGVTSYPISNLTKYWVLDTINFLATCMTKEEMLTYKSSISNIDNDDNIVNGWENLPVYHQNKASKGLILGREFHNSISDCNGRTDGDSYVILTSDGVIKAVSVEDTVKMVKDGVLLGGALVNDGYGDFIVGNFPLLDNYLSIYIALLKSLKVSDKSAIELKVIEPINGEFDIFSGIKVHFECIELCSNGVNTGDLSLFNTHKLGDKLFILGFSTYGKAMYDKGLIADLIIPKGVSGIRGDGFKCCTKLRSVTLPKGFDFIVDDGFYGCSNIQELRVNSKMIIRNSGFEACYKLRDIYINNIPIDELYSSYKLKDMTYLGVMPNALSSTIFSEHHTEDHILYVGNTVLSNSIPEYCDKVVIKNGVRAIMSFAFYKSNVTEVILPNSVRCIGEYAFYGSGLKKIYLGEGVETICSMAFKRCNNLKSIELPLSIDTLSTDIFDKGLKTVRTDNSYVRYYMKMVGLRAKVKPVSDF